MNERPEFHVLVVDDTPANLMTMRALLSRLDSCVIHEADSGEAALIATLEQRIHLILLDIQMPGMDGFETARHLGLTEATRGIPIIFVTAIFKAEEFAARGYSLGAVDYLTKPIDDSLLLNRVRLYQTLHERESRLAEALDDLGQAQRLLEQRHDLILANAGEGILGLDTQARITFINPTAERILGWPAAEALGLSGARVFCAHGDMESCACARILRGEQDALTSEELITRPDGSQVLAEIVRTAIREGGRVDGAVVVFRDLTERKRAEAELRTARDRAEAANRAKSTFLANMSHELRTPLNALLGYAQLLERDASLSASQHDAMETIRRSGNHLLNMISDLLDLAKIEAGRFELVPGRCNLPEIFAVAQEMFRLRAREKGLDFQVRFLTPIPPMVRADAKRLRQIVINLVGNAVKFTEQGRVAVEAGYTRGLLSVTVEDTGIGIAEGALQGIFEPFNQEGDAVYRAQGTGLGLAISRQITQVMGGELAGESTLGQGSRFIVRLPLEEIEGAGGSASFLPVAPALPGRVRGYRRTDGVAHPFRLLVVDDVADNRGLLHDWLAPLGFEVLAAEDGPQAVHIAQAEGIDLVVMDLVLGEMDGLEATRRILDVPGRSAGVPVIACSASVDEERRVEVMAAGCREFLGKPVNEWELLGVMGRFLPLEWEVEETVAVDTGTERVEAVLTPGQSEDLMELLRLGDLRTLKEHLAGLSTEGADPAALERLQTMARKFDLKGMRRLLEAGLRG